MRLVVQRVASASVEVEGERIAAIGPGLLVLVGVTHADDGAIVDALALKVAGLRIFADDAGLTNRSLLDVGGAALVVSQFTLYADTSRGRRPGFTAAAPPDQATELYLRFAARLRSAGVVNVQTGQFGASMEVALVNDGPFTIWLDSESA